MDSGIHTRFDALSRSAHLDVLLPKAADLDAVALIRAGKVDEIARAPARRNLFFDEECTTLVLLKTESPEDLLREALPGLELLLSAHATDAVPQGGGNAASASGKHDLASKAIPANDSVELVALEQQTFAVWKATLPLSRPRTRLQRPAIYFTANLNIADQSSRDSRKSQQDEYLKSFEPLAANVLEPLQYDPALTSPNIFLSESRITKVSPKTPNFQDTVRPIRGASKRAFPTVPALFSRVKYSSLPDATIVSLHLETSPLIAGAVTITHVQLSVPDADVEPLNHQDHPQETRAGDETVFLYKLASAKPAHSAAASISIAVTATASLDQGTHINLMISWQTHIDLLQPGSSPSYKWSRPLSAVPGHQRGLSTQSNPSFLPAEASQSQNGNDSGIMFCLTGPASVHCGSEFKIHLKCNNHSGRQRRFALVVLQPRRSTTTLLPDTSDEETDLVANIFNAPPLEKSHRVDVLDLNPDTRIGPLPAGACFETQLKFRALAGGALNLGTLRIVDMDSRQTADVREMPDVVSLENV